MQNRAELRSGKIPIQASFYEAHKGRQNNQDPLEHGPVWKSLRVNETLQLIRISL